MRWKLPLKIVPFLYPFQHHDSEQLSASSVKYTTSKMGLTCSIKTKTFLYLLQTFKKRSQILQKINIKIFTSNP